MRTQRSLFFMQISSAILLMIVSVLLLIVFELNLRLVDADQTSMKMCNELGRLVAHVERDSKNILSASLYDFADRGAYRRNWDIPILDRPRNAGVFRKIFEMSLESEERRMSNQNLPDGVRRK